MHFNSLLKERIQDSIT